MLHNTCKRSGRVKRYVYRLTNPRPAAMCLPVVLKACAITVFPEYREATSAARLPAGNAGEAVAPNGLAVRLVGACCRRVLPYGHIDVLSTLFGSSGSESITSPNHPSLKYHTQLEHMSFDQILDFAAV